MSSEWREVSLDEIAELNGGYAFKSEEYTNEGHFVLRTVNITDDGRISRSGATYVSPESAKKYERFLLKDLDTLFVMVGATLGKTGLVKAFDLPALLNQNMWVVRARNDQVDPLFLHYAFKVFSKPMSSLASGSARGFVKRDDFRQMKIRIPEIRVQREISNLLGALDDRITLLRETNATLEAIAQALFKSWFVDFDPVRAKMEGRTPEGMDEATAALFPDGFETSELGEVPKGWRVSRLADVTERITKGTTPTTLKRAFVPSGINFVKAESMTGDGGFIAEKFAFIDSETHALLARSQLQDGDVLISIAGTIGRLAVMTEDFLPANTNQAVALIRPNPDLLPSGLIYRLLRRNESQQKLAEKVVQAVQANLSLGTLSDLKLVVPPPSVVGRIFGAGLEQIDLIRVANDQRIRTLSTLRDTLLPRLISGQLRLPEAQAAVEGAL